MNLNFGFLFVREEPFMEFSNKMATNFIMTTEPLTIMDFFSIFMAA
jgi:hypothetical protein